MDPAPRRKGKAAHHKRTSVVARGATFRTQNPHHFPVPIHEFVEAAMETGRICLGLAALLAATEMSLPNRFPVEVDKALSNSRMCGCRRFGTLRTRILPCITQFVIIIQSATGAVFLDISGHPPGFRVPLLESQKNFTQVQYMPQKHTPLQNIRLRFYKM